jgi:hypothetical protein
MILAVCLLCATANAQKKNAAFELKIKGTAESVQVDGVADEAVWATTDEARDFYMVTPMDTSKALVHTTVRMTYDSDNLYLLAICYNKLKGQHMVESLRRDWAFGKNDNFLVFIDPFEDQTNGFAFGVNAAGAQWDGLMYEGGSVDLNWDNKWLSMVKDYPDRWVVEMAIPFKTLRFKKDISKWGINFTRNDLKTTEKSSWAPVPRQFPSAALAYTGTLVWDQPPPVHGANVSVIPYLLAQTSKTYSPTKFKDSHADIGGDVKIAVSSALNLDLTFNPDFSQVDVDKQVTNLDRYELFFPERRQFFLENADQLNNFGLPSVRPFFSRRIGLGVPIQFGGKLSGKLNRDWRISVLDMQTAKQTEENIAPQNYAVVAIQRKVFSRSNIGILLINRQSTGTHDGRVDSMAGSIPDYNRNIGLEYNLASSNNLWTGKQLILKSFTPGKSGDDLGLAGNLLYSGKKWKVGAAYEVIGKRYNAEVGYVPRQGYIKFVPQIAYTMFPKYGPVLTHGPQLITNYFLSADGDRTDDQTSLSYLITYRSKSTLTFTGMRDYVKLLFPFDPTNSGKDSLALGSVHRWNTITAAFVSKPQSVFTYGLSASYGGYYADGEKLSITADLGFRLQPILNIALSASYNELSLPEPWNRTKFLLVGPKVDLTLSRQFFLTTYVQYNEQAQNTNINARLQWRYKPASDLFIVYTDNYYPVPFSIRNRAIVLKFNYWWNL